jgi:hypothetical protein
MFKGTYRHTDPQPTDQELHKHLSQGLKASDTFLTSPTFEQDRSSEPTVNIIDYPCGFGKTEAMIAIINKRVGLKFLIVVQTLSEVDRVLEGTKERPLVSPEGPESTQLTKGQQLEDFIVSGASIVITHALYERAGVLARQGGLSDYNVFIDEVPNAVSLGRKVSLESFQEFYIDPGYCEMNASGLVVATKKGIEQAERLVEVLDAKTMEAIFSGRLFHDQKDHLIQTLPVYLFTHPLSVAVLTFMPEGSLFTQFLNKSVIPYKVLKGTNATGVFKRNARKNLTIDTIAVLEDLAFSFSKQEKYAATSKEVTKVTVALKNLKQRKLVGISLEDIMITCAKSNWYHTTRRKSDVTRAGPFSKNSRMFKDINWVPNTTRGTNNYAHCSHAIYLYEQNANPILLRWLGADTKVFKALYALSEMVQWIWRTRVRRGEPVHVYMPSKRMRGLLQAWLTLGASED